MKSTARQKTRPKPKSEHDERHRQRTKGSQRMREAAKKVLRNEPTGIDLEKGRPTDTGRFGA